MSRAFCVSAVFSFTHWGELVCRMGLPVNGYRARGRPVSRSAALHSGLRQSRHAYEESSEWELGARFENRAATLGNIGDVEG